MNRLRKIGLVWVILCLVFAAFSCGSETEQNSGEVIFDPEVKPPETVTVTMVVLGDNLLHMPVVNDGKKPDGSYDYSHIFAQLSDDIRNADIAVVGQESVLGGVELGLSGYPLFNSPQDAGRSLVAAGFDVVLHASNHVMDRGVSGIERTLAFWEEYPEVTVLGINKSPEEYDTVKIIERGGITFALLNYTYGTNGLPLPDGKEYMANLIDRDKIEKDIVFAREMADFVVVFPHWGNEYQMHASNEQKELARFMCGLGADVIVGSHPHVIEETEWIESENGNRAVVYYSLGNFVSRQKETRNLLGGMASLSFTKTGDEKSVSAALTPIVTHYDYNSRNFAVYKLKDYTDDLAARHGINLYDGKCTTERFRNIFEGVFETAPNGIEIDC